MPPEPGPRRSLIAASKEVYSHLSPPRRRMFFFVAILLVLSALAEVATIGAIFPFLAVLAEGAVEGPQSELIEAYRQWVIGLGYDPVWFSAAGLAIIASVSAALRLAISWLSLNFTFMTGFELSSRLLRRTFSLPYSFHIENNSSKTLSSLERVQHVLAYCLMPAMQAFTAGGVAIVILAALIWLDPIIALSAGAFFTVIYAAVSFASRRKLQSDSAIISDSLRVRVQVVQESLGGIRDLILDRTQSVFVEKFESVDGRFRRAQAIVYFISAAPRFVVEAASIVLIALLALYINSRPGGLISALPMLGAFAIGAQRLLPLVQQVYASWSMVMGSRAALDELLDSLGDPDEVIELPRPDTASPLPFADKLELAAVSYRYPSGDGDALKDINLVIPRGARVGLIGKSGSGKSTLVDLLMGLIEPRDGALMVDDRRVDVSLHPNWQRQVAHVPQMIFLADTSIAGNIAFGRLASEIDMERVQQAARDADLHAFIESLPDGYETQTGERGVRLSGGQRQRLGIARALYKRASLLVLDEATSALDDVTEKSVMESISGLSSDLTIVMIAHRLTTLRDCDVIYEMRDGRIARTGSYEDVTSR